MSTLQTCLLCALTLLTGCVSLKSDGLSRSTILLGVHVENDRAASAVINGLIASFEGESRNPGGQFAFPADAASTVSRAEFLLRVELSPGHYRLSRLSGVTRGGVDELRFDTEVDMQFEARSGATQYLGRIVLNGTDVKSVDAFKEDRVRLVRSWPSLRGRSIQHRQQPAIARVIPPPPPAPVIAGKGEYVPPAKLERDAEKLLPAGARPAFRKFLQARPPRAFAIAGSGNFGVASGGSNVVQRALQSCRGAAAAKRSCQLFALDDTLINSIDWTGKAP
jgi:hypothetical protein